MQFCPVYYLLQERTPNVYRQSQVCPDLTQCFRERTVTAQGPGLFDTQHAPQAALRMIGAGPGRPAILPVKRVHMETEE